MNAKNIDIYIEGNRLDLFEDENIVVNSSVQNIKDISKVFTDFSQSFTVPASQKNNRIFRHYYNADIEGGFDARTKKDSVIEVSKLPFKDGKIRLEKVSIKNGRPENYKITFFGNLVNLNDLFGDDELNDLDFSEYDHAYNTSNIVIGLTNGLSSGDIIYPLISSTRQWYYNSDTADHTDDDKKVNIAYHSGDSTLHGFLWTEIKPAIKARAIIDKIEETYDITFLNDFFGTNVLDNLYLWLSKEKGKLVGETDIYKLDFTNLQAGSAGFDLTNDYYSTTLVSHTTFSPQTGDEKITGGIIIDPTALYDDVEYSIYERKKQGGDITPFAENLTGYQSLTFETRFLENGTIDVEQTFFLKTKNYMEYDIQLTIEKERWNGSSWQQLHFEVVNAPVTGSTETIEVSNEFPKMKVKDFFTGLIKMYNLAVIPTSNKDFYVNTLDDWYADGSLIEVSKYIDVSRLDVARGNVLSGIKFKFEEDETILIDTFNKLNGYQYGNLETEFKDENGKKLDGQKLVFEVKFGQMIFERLADVSTGGYTTIQYGTAIDDKLDPADTKPLLFYAVSNDLDHQINMLRSSSTSTSFSGNVFMPAHVSNFSTKDYSTVFNAELNEYDATLIQNSLYKLFYEDYITDIFSEKRRQYSYTAKLPDILISTLKLNDRLLINDRRYIINDMEINLTNNNVKLELLNDIYDDLTIIPPIATKLQRLAFDTNDDEQACTNHGNDFTFSYYIPENSTFANTTLLFTNALGTDYAQARYYSDGNIVRYWNGGVFTTTSDCTPTVATKIVSLAYDNEDGDACANYDDNTRFNFFIPQNKTFATTDVLYSNFEGTIFTLPRYYSDGDIVRYWDGSSFTETVDCSVALAGGNEFGVKQVSLGYSSSSGAACSGTQFTFFIKENETFENATALYSNYEGTILTLTNYYSNGNVSRYWNKPAGQFQGTILCGGGAST